MKSFTGVIVAADDRRVALLPGPKRIAIAQPDGTVTASIKLGAPAAELPLVSGLESRIALAPDRLVVADGRRLRDGREFSIRVGGVLAKSPFRGLYIERRIHADLTASRLFYSNNLRTEAPGRVVFVPREELKRRLD